MLDSPLYAENMFYYQIGCLAYDRLTYVKEGNPSRDRERKKAESGKCHKPLKDKDT